MKSLPDTEFEIMDCLWDRPTPYTTAMVMEALGTERGWKAQTVVTLMGRLVQRGFLRCERGQGRENAFYPLLSRREYLQTETESFVERYHRHSYLSLLNALQSERLTPEELDEVSQWVQKQKEERQS